MERLGYASAIFLVSCSLPELYRGLTKGYIGISWGMLILWALGEVLGLIYVIHKKDKPLIANYLINSLLIGGLIWMKLK